MSLTWPMKVSYSAATLPYGGTTVNSGLGAVALVCRLGFVEMFCSAVSMLMLPVESDAVSLCRAGSVMPPVKSACQASLSGYIARRKNSASLKIARPFVGLTISSRSGLSISTKGTSFVNWLKSTDAPKKKRPFAKSPPKRKLSVT